MPSPEVLVVERSLWEYFESSFDDRDVCWELEGGDWRYGEVSSSSRRRL